VAGGGYSSESNRAMIAGIQRVATG
jgi:hypothetical protein